MCVCVGGGGGGGGVLVEYVWQQEEQTRQFQKVSQSKVIKRPGSGELLFLC